MGIKKLRKFTITFHLWKRHKQYEEIGFSVTRFGITLYFYFGYFEIWWGAA